MSPKAHHDDDDEKRKDATESPMKESETPDQAEALVEESKEDGGANVHSSASGEDATPESFDAVVRVARESSARKLISFVMYRLEKGGKVTLQALSLNVHKAI